MDGSFIVTLLIIIIIVVAIVVQRRKDSSSGVGTARSRAAAPIHNVAELAHTLQRGELPAPTQVSFRLLPGETCVGVVDADIEQWLEGDGSYTTKHVAWAGGLAGLAIGGAMNVAGNSWRKAAAKSEMAECWRMIGSYRIYVTTERLAFEGGGGREWHEYSIHDVRGVENDGAAVIVKTNGNPATRIHATPTAYWHMLLRNLVLGEVPGQTAR